MRRMEEEHARKVELTSKSCGGKLTDLMEQQTKHLLALEAADKETKQLKADIRSLQVMIHDKMCENWDHSIK